MTAGDEIGGLWQSKVILALGAVAAGSLLCFVLLAALALSGDAVALDHAILLALRMPGDLANAVGPWWFEVAVRDFSSLGSPTAVAIIGLLVSGYLLLKRAAEAAFFTALAIGGALLLERGAKLVFGRARPDLVPHGIETHSTSFPSGHALLSTATCLCLAALVARAEQNTGPKVYAFGAAVLTALMIGASRVYLGVHWPTDVLAGWCLGNAWIALCGLGAVLLRAWRQASP